MRWIFLLGNILRLVSRLFGWIKARRRFRAGQRYQAARALKEQYARVEKARAARRARRNSDDGMRDDPYLRD